MRMVRASCSHFRFFKDIQGYLLGIGVSLVVGSVWLGWLVGPVSATASPPLNVMLILADDMGYGDLEVYGSSTIKTPALNQLAAQGLRFSDFYVNPACCPTRSGLMTGRQAIRLGLDLIITMSGPSSSLGLKSEEKTLAEVLAAQGYNTALIGKWHLGNFPQYPQYHPNQQGFEYYYGTYGSNDANNGQIPLYQNASIIQNPVDQRYLTQLYTDQTKAFLTANQNQPFFLYLSYNAPHVPLFVSPEFAGKSAGGLYGDVVQEMDWSIGQIMAHLKALNLETKTLVIFLSDNGPWLAKGNQAGKAGPLRCGKASTFEGGIRVPAIASWLGHLPAGTVNSEPMMGTDLYPTILSLAGVPIPTDRVLDGVDLSQPWLSATKRPDQDLVFYFENSAWAVREGKWKLKQAHPGGPSWGGACVNEAHPQYLFDLSTDISETTNLAAQHPGVVSYLTGEINAYKAALLQPTNQPPVAVITLTGGNNKTLSLSASGSSDRDGTIGQYQWAFGDNQTTQGMTVTHTYAQAGTYVMTLTVTDNGGLQDGQLLEVNVPVPSPTSSPGTSPSPSPSGCAYDYTNDNRRDIKDLVVILNGWGNPYGMTQLLGVLMEWGVC